MGAQRWRVDQDDDVEERHYGRRHRTLWISGAVVVVLFGTLGLSRLPHAAPEVERATLLLDTVTRGPMIRQVHGNGTEWTLSSPVNLQPENVTGWQVLSITLVPGGTKSDFQTYNFYIDPYVRR